MSTADNIAAPWTTADRPTCTVHATLGVKRAAHRRDPRRHHHDGRPPMTTTWTACPACGAMTRHDDGLCIRDTRHPRAHQRAARGSFTHTPATPSFRERGRGGPALSGRYARRESHA